MLEHDLGPLCDLDARVVLFPVRHHSPTAARLVREQIATMKPSAVLVEGPADFNDRISELFLPHRPPIAIYSYVRLPGGARRGAYYPLCEHSPEWQAVQAANEVGALVRFIDLHWADVAVAEDEPVNRYNDAVFRRSAYIAELCKRLGVEDFNALWDTLIEIDAGLPLETYLRRCHTLCGNMRLAEGAGGTNDRRREAFMAAQVRAALDASSGQVLVVTGGYHSIALHARLTGKAPSGMAEPSVCSPRPPQADEERGIALTPYSFERLDSLAGYEAGMPNPGFYQQLWSDRRRGRADSHKPLLQHIAGVLRERKQVISSADLIAAESTARALAALRAHPVVWRTDLVDGLTAALVKDELATTGRHPLLDAVHEVLRGGERGLLAEGAMLPPLVLDMQRQLAELDLVAQGPRRELELDLHDDAARARSRVLHRLRALEVPGYEQTGGTDFTSRDDLARVWEVWEIAWSPDFDARCIEAARYGPTLADAAVARLAELAEAIERDAGKAALLLVDAALAGLTQMATALHDRVLQIIRSDGDFFGVTTALGHLLYLYRYDTALGTAGLPDVRALLVEAFGRGLWLLEGLGQVAGQDTELSDGIVALRETVERCPDVAGVERTVLVDVLGRIGADRAQRPLLRGAALGARWALGAAVGDDVRAGLRLFADPSHLGDFLTGLFALAREQVQRQRDLVVALNDLLAGYADEQFLAALPALRLAFTYFTPREKHHFALALREALGLVKAPEMAALDVGVEVAARALALEGKLFAMLDRYGIRGGPS